MSDSSLTTPIVSPSIAASSEVAPTYIAALSEVAPTGAPSSGGAGAPSAPIPVGRLSLLMHQALEETTKEYTSCYAKLTAATASLETVTLNLQAITAETTALETQPAVIAYLAALQKKTRVSSEFQEAWRLKKEENTGALEVYNKILALTLPIPTGGAAHDESFVRWVFEQRPIDGHKSPYVLFKDEEAKEIKRPICPACALIGKLHPLTPLGWNAHWDTVFEPAFRKKKPLFEESFGPEGGDIRDHSKPENPLLKGRGLGHMNKWEELYQRAVVVNGKEPVKMISNEGAYTCLLRCNYYSGCSLLLPVIEGKVVLPPSLKQYILDRS